MTIRFGAFAYALCAAITLGSAALSYLAFAKRSEKAKNVFVLVLIALNIFQHFFKFIIWPTDYGSGFGLKNTAYNMCAFLIILMPIAYFSKSVALKNFACVAGTFAGLGASLIPMWFFGKNPYLWEVIRFYFCHILLFLTAALPVAFGTVKIAFKNFLKMPIMFFGAIIIVYINNTLAYFIAGGKAEGLYSYLSAQNPMWAIRPPEFITANETALKIVNALVPPFFKNVGGMPYMPFLWYIIPFGIALFALSLLVCYLFDKNGAREFFNKDKRA